MNTCIVFIVSTLAIEASENARTLLCTLRCVIMYRHCPAEPNMQGFEVFRNLNTVTWSRQLGIWVNISKTWGQLPGDTRVTWTRVLIIQMKWAVIHILIWFFFKLTLFSTSEMFLVKFVHLAQKIPSFEVVATNMPCPQVFNFFFNWRKIALQCCIGFCFSATQISHN